MEGKIKIGVLTSSRADYGIYQPLLKLLAKNDYVELHIIVFGMHLLSKFGNTLNNIEKDAYGEIHIVAGLNEGDSPLDVSDSYASLINNFGKFWNENTLDKVLALGDRFEMSAAVQASIPFEVTIAHLHGGETTLGAIDNIYRHQISLASKMHFVCTEIFRERVQELTHVDEGIYNVGALSIDGLDSQELPEWRSVKNEFDIPCDSFVLLTFHPETVGLERNIEYVKQCYKALEVLCTKIHLVFTMANADPMGSLYREMAHKLKNNFPSNITLVENFGKLNYFAAMKQANYLLGNTSSGILEAASFNKYVINVGNRQKGRLRSENVIDVPFDAKGILEAVKEIESRKEYSKGNVYSKPETAIQIMKLLVDA